MDSVYTLSQLETVKKDEAEIVFSAFTPDDAFRLSALVFRMAQERQAAICAQVVLNGFEVVRFFRKGTDESNIIWLTRKKNSVYRSGGWSSLRCGMEAQLHGIHEPWHQDTDDYVIRGGGVPIHTPDGVLLGALCISGLVHLQDHQMAMEALRAFMESDRQISV